MVLLGSCPKAVQSRKVGKASFTQFSPLCFAPLMSWLLCKWMSIFFCIPSSPRVHSRIRTNNQRQRFPARIPDADLRGHRHSPAHRHLVLGWLSCHPQRAHTRAFRSEVWVLLEMSASGTCFAPTLMSSNSWWSYSPTAALLGCAGTWIKALRPLLRASRGLAAEAHPCTSPGWWSLFLPGQQRSWGGQEAFPRGGPR